MDTLTRYNDFKKLKKKVVSKNTTSQVVIQNDLEIEKFLLNLKRAKLKKGK